MIRIPTSENSPQNETRLGVSLRTGCLVVLYSPGEISRHTEPYLVAAPEVALGCGMSHICGAFEALRCKHLATSVRSSAVQRLGHLILFNTVAHSIARTKVALRICVALRWCVRIEAHGPGHINSHALPPLIADPKVDLRLGQAALGCGLVELHG
jgi:hypothetical protein